MALSLLKKVAEKALTTVGGAASSALNYLTKHAPDVIDKTLESNPTTRVFSKQGQREVANVGRFLQKMPDTTIKAPERPQFIKTGNDLADFALNNPVQKIQDKAGELITGVPGEFVRSWGRTLERTATPEGRKKIVTGAQQLPGQIGDVFTKKGHRLESLGKVVENPAFEDALNAADLFALGAGTALKATGKEAVEQTVKQGVKQGVKKTTQELIEQGAKTGTRELAEQGAETTAKKLTKELFENTAKNADTSIDEVIEKVPQIASKKTQELFDKSIDGVVQKLPKTKKGTMYITPEGTVLKTNKPPKTTAGLDAVIEQAKQINPNIPPRSGEPLLLESGTKNVPLLPEQSSFQNMFDEGVRKAQEVVEANVRKTKELFRKPEDITRRWISTREGFSNWRGADIKKNPALTQFDNEGMNAIIDLQSGKNATRYTDIKNFTDGLYELEKKAGLLEPENYRKNYLPQMWDNTPEEIEQVFKTVVGKKPGFTKQRLLEDYKTGIEAGLTPRYNTMSDLLEARFKSSQRALADKELVDNLITTGNAKTLDKAPKGWIAVDLTQDGKRLAVPPKVAQIINNYTGTGSSLLEKTAQFVSEAKQTILSAGIPKTGWNFHTGVNVPARAAAARKNPFGAVIDSVIWNTNPKSAQHYIDNVVPKDITDGLLKAGLTISRSADDAGYGFKPKPGTGALSKARNWWDRIFSEAAFDKVLPAHKLKVGWETYQNALKKGMSQDEAFRIAADTANEVFGGVDPRVLGRSKDFQNVLRTFLLAPDWLESNVRIAGRLGGLVNPKNWADPRYAPYKRFAVNAASMYTSFAMLNKALSGHFPWENGKGQEFNLATGTYDERGRERMIPVFGTAFDFVRIPLQLVSAIGEGDPEQVGRVLRNRLSPPVSAATSLFITGEDYRGRKIDSPGEIIGQVAQAVGVPSQVTNIVGGLTGEQTPEEVLYGLFEAPVRFRGGANTAKERKTAELLKQGGATNEQIAQAVSDKPPKKNGVMSWFGGGQPSGDIALPKSAADRKEFNSSVDQALEAGVSDFSDEVLRERFFKGKTYDKSARAGQREILEEMLKVADDEYLTPEQKTRISQAANIDGVDLEYYRAASMSQDDRLEGLLMYAMEEHENRDDFIMDLALGKRAVGGKSMFSTTMFDRLYDEGLISKEEKALLSAIKYDPVFNKFYMDRDYKGSGGGGGGMTPAKVRSYINSVNALHKNTFNKTKGSKTSQKPVELPEVPQIKLPKTSKGVASKTSSSRWFTPY